jgi:hypothetical protein
MTARDGQPPTLTVCKPEGKRQLGRSTRRGRKIFHEKKYDVTEGHH